MFQFYPQEILLNYLETEKVSISINVQAICDHELKITNAGCGTMAWLYPYDSRFNNSNVCIQSLSAEKLIEFCWATMDTP